MNRNRIRICGRKTTTLPTPAMMPSAIRLDSADSPSVETTAAPSDAAPPSIRSMSGVAQANTAWKTISMTRNNPSVPGSGRLKKSTMRLRQEVSAAPWDCTSFMTSRTQA